MFKKSDDYRSLLERAIELNNHYTNSLVEESKSQFVSNETGRVFFNVRASTDGADLSSCEIGTNQSIYER